MQEHVGPHPDATCIRLPWLDQDCFDFDEEEAPYPPGYGASRIRFRPQGRDKEIDDIRIGMEHSLISHMCFQRLEPDRSCGASPPWPNHSYICAGSSSAGGLHDDLVSCGPCTTHLK